MTKLSTADVIAIRHLLSCGETAGIIADTRGCSRQTVEDIRDNRTHTGRGHTPQYVLYVRKRDGAARLVEQESGYVVDIRMSYGTKRAQEGIAGVFVEVDKATGVFLMPDEIIVVDEF